MRLVIIESPFAASATSDVAKNLRYLRACMRDCLLRGEAPYASHALYTQPGVLDDASPSERDLGIRAGFAFREVVDTSCVYTDLGISRGMQAGINDALTKGRTVEMRSLGSDWDRRSARATTWCED